MVDVSSLRLPAKSGELAHGGARGQALAPRPGHNAEKFWYDCNGSLMARTNGTGSRSSYAWDENNRLEAVAEGAPVTWTSLVNVTVNSATGDLSKTNASAWDAGVVSTQSLSGDGAVSFRARHGVTPRALV